MKTFQVFEVKLESKPNGLGITRIEIIPQTTIADADLQKTLTDIRLQHHDKVLFFEIEDYGTDPS